MPSAIIYICLLVFKVKKCCNDTACKLRWRGPSALKLLVGDSLALTLCPTVNFEIVSDAESNFNSHFRVRLFPLYNVLVLFLLPVLRTHANPLLIIYESHSYRHIPLSLYNQTLMFFFRKILENWNFLMENIINLYTCR